MNTSKSDQRRVQTRRLQRKLESDPGDVCGEMRALPAHLHRKVSRDENDRGVAPLVFRLVPRDIPLLLALLLLFLLLPFLLTLLLGACSLLGGPRGSLRLLRWDAEREVSEMSSQRPAVRRCALMTAQRTG